MDEAMDEIWCALANPLRRAILDDLRDGPRTTGDLADLHPKVSRFAVMQHLEVLTDAGLVLVRRDGRQRFNYLNAVPLQEVYERWVARFARPAAASAMALGRYLDDTKRRDMEQNADRIAKIEMEQRFDAPIEKVFAALTTELDNWWAFRFKNESKVIVEPWVGGRIYEDWGDGNGALYGNIVYLDPPYKVASRGPGGINGNFSNFNWDILERDGEGTKRKVSLRMWGEVPDEMEKMFTEGSKAIMEKLLKDYVETGKTWRDAEG
jgi:DNA-binding transcriptional ArsR family regulator/uncharacterized protein YndB with AHSA1/START domain